MSRLRLVALLLLLATLSPSLVAVARPGDEGRTRQNLNETRERLRYERKRLDIVNEREQDIARQLNQTQAGLQESQQVLEVTVGRLSRAEDRLVQIRERLQATRARLKKSQAALERRLRQIYTEGDVGYLVVLLGSDSFTDFLDHARYLSLVVESDRKLLDEVRDQKAEFESQEQAARETVAEIGSLRATQQDRVARLSQLEDRRSELLADVRTQRSSIKNVVVELEGTTQELEDRLRKIIAAEQSRSGTGGRPVPRGTGRFVWPASGPVLSNFGYRVHPISGTLRMHTGLDIAAPGGAPIRAADNGVVIHSGWYGGYGNCLIIDHGGGYSTLYGHCSALYFGYGRAVRQGQTVAAVGSTGYSTGPHLHFEVRVNGNPVDPRGFL